MCRYEGNRVPGRWAARRIRRRSVAKVYHHRVRDGQRVVWSEDDGGRLRLIVPYDAAAGPRRIAFGVLDDAIGEARALRLAESFEAILDTFGDRWDWPDEYVREVADWIEGEIEGGRLSGD